MKTIKLIGTKINLNQVKKLELLGYRVILVVKGSKQ